MIFFFEIPCIFFSLFISYNYKYSILNLKGIYAQKLDVYYFYFICQIEILRFLKFLIVSGILFLSGRSLQIYEIFDSWWNFIFVEICN